MVSTQVWQDKYRDKLITPKQAAKLVKSGDKVIFSLSVKPVAIGMALAERASELRGVTVGSTWGGGDFPFLQPGMEESFTVITGMSPRTPMVANKQGDWFIWLPSLGVDHRQQNRGGYHLYADVFYLVVTPPDDEGYCSFGPMVWYSTQAAKTAKLIVAEVHPQIMRAFGDRIHISQIDYLVEPPPRTREELTAIALLPAESSAEEYGAAQVIGAYVADLVKDGDTFQLGYGVAVGAVLEFLGTKNDLGVDIEMFPVGVVELVKAGVITGKRKSINKGKVVATGTYFHRGDPRVVGAAEFINENPMFEFHDISYMCNIPRIAQNRNMVSINTILRIDLYGQVQISHVGTRPITSIGGQVDYTIGTHYSKGGRAISCTLSTALGGKVSRIVPQFEQGSVVDLPMHYVDYLVTEYGVVNLEYKTHKQKAEAIISVAHPDFQPELREAAKKLFYP